MNRLFLSSVALICSLAGSFAGSIEQVPPTPQDIARELGMSMVKFAAKFEEPVYLTIELRILSAGQPDITVIEQVAPSAAKSHEFSLTLKDMNALYEKLGLTKSGDAKGALDISLAHPQVGFTRREKNPFGKLAEGQSFMTWSRRQSMEPLKLDELLPVLIKAGPFTKDKPRPNDLVSDYEKSPAYIWLGVKFTKDKPAEESEPEPAPPKKEAPKKAAK